METNKTDLEMPVFAPHPPLRAADFDSDPAHALSISLFAVARLGDSIVPILSQLEKQIVIEYTQLAIRSTELVKQAEDFKLSADTHVKDAFTTIVDVCNDIPTAATQRVLNETRKIIQKAELDFKLALKDIMRESIQQAREDIKFEVRSAVRDALSSENEAIKDLVKLYKFEQANYRRLGSKSLARRLYEAFFPSKIEMVIRSSSSRDRKTDGERSNG